MKSAVFVWTKESYLALKRALAEARQAGRRTFTVDLDKRHKDVPFSIAEADTIVDILPELLEPPRYYPENREGNEP